MAKIVLHAYDTLIEKFPKASRPPFMPRTPNKQVKKQVLCALWFNVSCVFSGI